MTRFFWPFWKVSLTKPHFIHEVNWSRYSSTYQLLNIESQKIHIESQLTWKIKTVQDTMHGFEWSLVFI